MIMENTNDKTAVQMVAGRCIHGYAQMTQEQVITYGDARAEEARREAEHQRNLLAEAIRDAAVKAGIADPAAQLTGPHLLMLANDMADALAQRTAGGDAALLVCQIYEIASEYFTWNHPEGWRKATQGTVNMTGLEAFTRTAVALAFEQALAAQPVAEAAAQPAITEGDGVLLKALADKLGDYCPKWVRPEEKDALRRAIDDYTPPDWLDSKSAAQADDGLTPAKSLKIMQAMAEHMGNWGETRDEVSEEEMAHEALHYLLAAAPTAQLTPKKGQQVGCERDDGLLNIHAESETCEVCRAQPDDERAVSVMRQTNPDTQK